MLHHFVFQLNFNDCQLLHNIYLLHDKELSILYLVPLFLYHNYCHITNYSWHLYFSSNFFCNKKIRRTSFVVFEKVFHRIWKYIFLPTKSPTDFFSKADKLAWFILFSQHVETNVSGESLIKFFCFSFFYWKLDNQLSQGIMKVFSFDFHWK